VILFTYQHYLRTFQGKNNFTDIYKSDCFSPFGDLYWRSHF